MILVTCYNLNCHLISKRQLIVNYSSCVWRRYFYSS